jgi:hypothetical protein
MKKLIALVLLFSINAQAACDWKTGITPGPNKTFIYNEDCHQEVGKLVQANKDLTAAIQLKDLAIKYDDERVALWQKSADDELQRLNTIQNDQKKSDWVIFGLGVATTFVAAYAASRIYH